MAESIVLGIILRFRDEASRGVKSVLGGVEHLGEEADRTRERMAKLQSGLRQIRDVGVGLAGMGAAAAGALYSAIKPAAALQEQVRNALTLTGKTGEAFTRMEEGMTARALALSSTLGISADQVAESFYRVLSAGAKALSPDFDTLSETALKMAKTVGIAPADAVEVLADTVNQFDLNLSHASRVADVFFTATKLSTLTVPEMVDSLREAGSTAAAMGASIEETAAVIAGFADKGIKGARAGTAFRMILTKLVRPPDDAARALRILGVSVFDASGKMRPVIDILKDMQKGMASLTGAQKAAVLKAIAGEEAFAKLGGLLEGDLGTLEAWRGELAKGGALEIAFAQKMGAASEQVNLLWISVKNLAISIGQPLLSALSGASAWLAKVLQGVSEFTKAHPIIGKVIGVTLAAAGAFGILAGTVLTVAGMMGLLVVKWLPLARAGMAAFSGIVTKAIPTFLGWGRVLWASAQAGKIHALMTADVSKAIGGLATATWSGVKAATAWTVSTVKDLAIKAAHAVAVVAGTVATWASAAASKAAAAAQWLWNAAMTANPIGLIIAGVAALVAGVVLLIRNWDTVTGAVKAAFGWLRGLLSKAPDWLLALVFPIGLIVKHFDRVKEVASSVFGAIRQVVGAVVSAVTERWEALKQILLDGLSPIDLIRQGWESLKEAAVEVFGAIAGTVSSAFEAVRSAVGSVFDWVADKIAWITDKVNAVFGFLRDVGSFLGLTSASAGVGGGRAGGTMAVSATAPSAERAVVRPTPTRSQEALLPALEFAGAGGPVDQSIVIQAGAIQIHAVRVDEQVVRQIDYELARLIRRRQERQ